MELDIFWKVLIAVVAVACAVIGFIYVWTMTKHGGISGIGIPSCPPPPPPRKKKCG